MDTEFCNAVKQQVIRQDTIDRVDKENLSIRKMLKGIGFENVEVVKEQEMQDDKFYAVIYPNSEEKAVFDIAISYNVRSKDTLTGFKFIGKKFINIRQVRKLLLSWDMKGIMLLNRNSC